MKSKGFTLIELFSVVVIIGLLVAVVIVGYSKNLKKSRCTRIIDDFYSIANAAGLYREVKGSWAPETSGVQVPAFVPEFLSEWPTADFYKSRHLYDWENWDTILAISIRPPSGNMVYYYCVQDNRDGQNDCQTSSTILALNRGGSCP